MPMILNEEQTMLRDSAVEFCTNQAPISQLRELRDSANPDGFDRATWQSMVELGWASIPWPEDVGGLDFGYKGLGVVTEETGKTLAASPLFSSVWLGGTLVNLAGSADQRSTLLAGLASGDAQLAVALEESGRHDPYGIATTATGSGAAMTISGDKTFVLDGQTASSLIVVARSAGKPGERDGLTLALVDPSASGVSIIPTNMVDSRAAANIHFDNAPVVGVLGAEGQAADALDQALDIARIGLSAEMLGSAQECFDRTIAYLKERQQFGVVIGTFQGLKHRAAEMFCDLELARSCVLEALTALDEGRDATEIAKLASLTKAKVGEISTRVSREGVQMHGGIGMTDEFDIGFFLKRAAVTEQALGDVHFHRDRYGLLEGY